MTLLSYSIGDFTTYSYEEAVRYAKENNKRIKTILTPYYGDSWDYIHNYKEEEEK